MVYGDLRDWLKDVEERGELRRLRGASWDLEMSNLTDLLLREGKSPTLALLFDEVPGFPTGFRTLFALTASAWRIAHTLGLPEDATDRMSLVRNWRRKRRTLRHIPPKTVASGPVQENVDTGVRIDLMKFPAPMFHELDGGRYIGTACAVIQKDPDEGWVNLGTYRAMLVDRNHLAFHAVEGQHGRIIADKYFSRGQAMPVALAIGIDPALYCAAAHGMTGWGVSEYDFAGAIKGEPIEVFKGITGLPIPSRAEIVIEGECRPSEMVQEGPFGEFHGYYANLGLSAVQEPLIEVKAIYYRNDPILTCMHMGLPPHEGSLLASMLRSATIWDKLDAFGVHGVNGVWCHEFAAGYYFDVISIEQTFSGQPRQVGNLAALSSAHFGRYTVVVEEDIDPCNLEQVMWAVVTRGRPREAIHIIDRCPASSSDPAIPLAEKKQYEVLPKPLYSSRVVIDGCRPFESKPEWYPMVRVSPELRSKLIRKFPGIIE